MFDTIFEDCVNYIIHKLNQKTFFLIVFTSLMWIFLPYLIGGLSTLILASTLAIMVNDKHIEYFVVKVTEILKKL